MDTRACGCKASNCAKLLEKKAAGVNGHTCPGPPDLERTRPRECHICTAVYLTPNVTESFCMPRHHRLTECLGALVSHSVLALDPFDLTSSCNHNGATSMCVLRPVPCLWRTCSVASASTTNPSFIVNPRSHIIDTTPSDSMIFVYEGHVLSLFFFTHTDTPRYLSQSGMQHTPRHAATKSSSGAQ